MIRKTRGGAKPAQDKNAASVQELPEVSVSDDGDVRYLNNRISEYMTFGSVLPEGSTFPLQLG